MRTEPSAGSVVKDVDLDRKAGQVEASELRHHGAIPGRQQIIGECTPGRAEARRMRDGRGTHMDERPRLVLISLLPVVSPYGLEVVVRKRRCEDRRIGDAE